MKRPSFLMPGVALGAACLVAGFSSYRLARERAAFEPSAPPATKAGPASGKEAEATVIFRSPNELASVKERLKHSYAACPSAAHDWILRGQTTAILATMTTTGLESLLREILSPYENKMAAWRMTGWELALAGDLLREWGKRDPVAACMATGDTLYCADGRLATFREWLLRDPEAVAKWMNSADAVPADLRKAWLSERAKTDPQGALEQLAGLAPKVREDALREWSVSCALEPTGRAALLAAVGGDAESLRKCAGHMAVALAERSVEEAYAFVDGLEVDEETATALDDDIFANWAEREPQTAFAGWAKQKETRVPDSFLRAFDSWSINSPGAEQAIEWVGALEPGPAKEKIQFHFIDRLAWGDRFDQAVRMGLSMENREEGKRQVLRVAAKLKELSPKHARELLEPIFREAGWEMP